jgi:hypothetical protein
LKFFLTAVNTEMEFVQHTVLNYIVGMWDKTSKQQFEKQYITQLEFRINKTSKNDH